MNHFNIEIQVERQQVGLQLQTNADLMNVIRRHRKRAPRRMRDRTRQWLGISNRLYYGHYSNIMLMPGLWFEDSTN